jgi:hypothetical protein
MKIINSDSDMKVVPLTKEQKASIVDRVERRFSIHIIDGAYHIEECRCQTCLDVLLEALANKSEQILKDMIDETI